ncbi:condensin-2 complex subunit D3-like [Argiope bruennichi]|uniref:Condensin-2 complex subunit D3 like protein n=1 Tax=Argiope bruennichi TaxID=94029 RepID=A0A8T0E6S6_ARGBR|nr:condensin-2 complex subunit D3-like [Argiope bruennichi]KAF8767087.1 Condensin-2 complex subunit D3 like protein [Argiope bruennichi]
MGDNLLQKTSRYFDSVNFSELIESWLEEVFENEFTDVEDINMSLGILFTDDPKDTLLKICDVCEDWIKKPSDFDQDESSMGNVSTRPEDVLWTYLNEMDIEVKHILGIIYFLCSKALKNTSTEEDKVIGLISAKWYFCCLRVPGSSAYSVYKANLFRLCMDCFQIVDIENLLPEMTSAVESLIPLLTVCHLGSDSTTVDYVIAKLCELVGSEQSSASLNFDLNILSMPERERRRRTFSFILTSLAFQGLSTLINSDLNGEKDYIYSVILSNLNRHILCSRVKKTSIPAKFMCVKDNCVSYICYNLKKDPEICSKLTLTSIKRLCLSVSDKAEFRAAVSNAVVTILYNLQVQDFVDFIQWLLLLVDAAEGSNRVFALEVMGLLLGNFPQINKEGLPEAMEVYLTPIPIIFAILTRCDDVSPAVRTKALGVLSQHMQHMLNALMDVDFSNYVGEEFDEEIESYDINGENRQFWYKFSSFKDMVDEMNNILHRRVEDNNGMSRKAALQALENIVSFDVIYLTDENLKLFVSASRDINIVVRKQIIQSLTSILETYSDHPKAQECWLKSIFPLVQDPENTVQAKVLSVIEEKFLLNILSDKNEDKEALFLLLEKLARGEYLSYQRYLQKAFKCWKDEKKLKPNFASKLEKFFGSGKDEPVWFYLSIFGAFCKLPTKICQLALEEFQKPENWDKSFFMENILKVLNNAFRDLPSDDLEVLRGVLKKKLEDFAAPVEIMPLMIEILFNIETYLKMENDFAGFADKMMQMSMDTLTPFISRKKSRKLPEEDLAVKSLTILKEFCQLFPKSITQNITVLVKSFIYTRNDEAIINATKVSSRLRAHAFASLGKISLHDDQLSKELLPVLAKELLTSKEDMLRNNAVLILTEMCRRYSGDSQYISLVTSCFKDRRYIIRYQVITFLVSLLQEGYVKTKNNLVYCLLPTIIDKYETIQELGKYCLGTLMFEKKKTIFLDSFTDTVFIFNKYHPPDNDALAQTVKDMERFAIPGEDARETRMQIYKFMITCMEEGSRGLLVSNISRDILNSVADGVFPLDDVVKCIVRDCFAVLTSKEIRVFDSDSIAHELEDGDDERVAKAELEIRKAMLVQPIVPVMISLKNCVLECKSDLLSDIVLFLKEILSDYKNEIEDILVDDKMLKMQVLFEIRNECNQQEKEAKEKKNKEMNAKKPNTPPSGEHIIEKTKEISNYLIRKSLVIPGDGNTSSAGSKDVSLRLIPQTPQNRNVSRKSNAVVDDMDVDDDINLPSTSGQPVNVRDIIFSSTPRVLLKPLKFKTPNLSKISIRVEDLDIDDD